MNKNKFLLFILLLTVVIRLYHITFPVIGWQSWRQADTASIAKNFYLNGYNILYPQIEWRGATEGYVESEFHIYPFIVSLFYGLFGVNDMWGRIVSVIFAVFTVYGLYLLVRRIISEKTALWSAFIYAILPLNIYFTRAFMPESAMLMCSVFGIYFFNEWLESQRWKNFIFSFVFIALAALIKLPALYLGLPLLFLSINKFGKSFLFDGKLWLYTAMVFIPVGIWYYHSHQLFLQTGLTFNIWTFGKDKWGMTEPLFTLKFYNDIFFKSIAERHLTYAGFIVFIWGLFLKRDKPKEKLFDWWLIAIIIFIFIAPQAHLTQEYYQLPFNIPASVFIAKVFSKYFNLNSFKEFFKSNKFAVSFLSICFVCILTLSFLRMGNFMKSEDYNASVFNLKSDVKLLVPREDLIIVINDGNPTLFYICDRRGWFCSPEDIKKEFIHEKKNQGARFIISETKQFKTEQENESLKYLFLNYNVVKSTDDYFIVKLD